MGREEAREEEGGHGSAVSIPPCLSRIMGGSKRLRRRRKGKGSFLSEERDKHEEDGDGDDGESGRDGGVTPTLTRTLTVILTLTPPLPSLRDRRNWIACATPRGQAWGDLSGCVLW